MNFDFTPIGDTKLLLRGKAQNYFEKARRGQPSQTRVHREWVRDVFTMFALKAEVSVPQGIQLIKTGEFNRAHAMHARHWEKTPPYIASFSGSAPNPVHIRYEALKNMRHEDNHGFIRDAFIWATSLRHPNEYVGQAKSSEPDIPKVNKRHIKHDDETGSAHVRRTKVALTVALNPSEENVRELGKSFGL